MREWENALRARLTRLGLPPDEEASLIDELSQHLEDEAASLRSRGCSEAGVRERVLAPLDDAVWLEHLRARATRAERRNGQTLPPSISSGVWGDVTYAMRALARAPAFTAIAVVSLALGIGGTTAIFSLLHTVLLERLAIPDAEQLVALRPTGANPDARESSRIAPAAGSGVRIPLSVSVFRALANTPAVPRIEAFATAPIALRVGDEADYPYADFVSSGYFDLLDVRPERGRWITASDDDSRAPVAVISHQYWQRMFAGDDGIIGRVVDVGTARITIIGVAPPRYRGLYFSREFTVALPLSLARLSAGPLGGDLPVVVVTRRARTVSIDAVAARLDAAYRQCCASGWRLVGEDASRGLRFAFDPRHEYGRLLKLLMAGVAMLLIVACANVAALLLSRALARRREIAIRMAMGASRARILRLLLVESALLTAVGTVLGLALARLGTELLSRNLPGTVAPLANLIALRANAGLLGFTIAVSAVCTILFGTLPALRAGRTDVRESLSGERARPRRTRWPSDRILVVVQVGLALALLSTAGLMTATLRNLKRGASAFSDARLLFVDIDTRSTAYQKTGIQPLREDILSRVRSVPDVRAVALAFTTPVFGRARASTQFTIVGQESTPSDLTVTDVNFATAEFFAATSLPILRGRVATEFEDDAVTVSESFAKRFFPGRDPLGAELVILLRPRPARIVGVVADARYMELRAPARPIVYLPLTAWYGESLGAANLVLRTAEDPRIAAQSVRDAIVRASPGIRLRRVQTANQALAEGLPRERLAAALAFLFGVVALALAGVGLYGVVSYDVARRSKELGIRMALGATAGDVVMLVLRDAATMCAIGIMLGVLPAFALGRAFAAQLYGIEPMDPRVVAGAMAVLAIAALAASLGPGIRAARVDPLVAIRTD